MTDSITTEVSAESSTFTVEKALPKCYIDEFTERLKKLNRKARRFGFAETTFKKTGEETRRVEVDYDSVNYCFIYRNVRFVILKITGEEVQIPGWKFLATVEPVTDKATGQVVNMVRSHSETPVLEKYRSATMDCEHCGKQRKRSACYVLQSIDCPGSYRQVGKSCMGDFLQVASGEVLANKLSYYTEMWAELDNNWDDEGLRCGLRSEVEVELYIAYVLECIKQFGYISKGMDQANNTAGTAWMFADTPRKFDLSDEAMTEKHGAEANIIAEYWRNHQGRSDFEHNCRTAIRSGFATMRLSVFVAGAVSAYLKERDADRLRKLAPESHYVGAIGERLKVSVKVISNVLIREDGEWGPTFLHTFATDSGSILKWWTGRDLTESELDAKSLNMTGRVAEHSEYKGRKETQVKNVRLLAPVAEVVV